MYTPVAPGIPYSKLDCNYPIFDVAEARRILLEEDPDNVAAARGLTAASTDADWIDVADTDPIKSYNCSRYTPSSTWEALVTVMVDNFKYIGIELTDAPCDDVALDLRINIPENYRMVDLFILGWGPDYLDPHNMIYDAFAGPEATNPMNVANNPDFADWVEDLEAAVIEQDVPTREQMYYDIQCELIEEIVPWIMMMTRADFFVHTNEITKYPYNPHGRPHYYGIVFEPAQPVVIPGYNLMALFGAIGIAAIFLTKKYRK